MNRGRSLRVRLAWTAAVLLALVFVLALLTPFLIDREAVRGSITVHLSQLVEGRVETREISLSFLPRPHIKLHQAEVIIPGTMRFQSASITVYPLLQPLLRGKIKVRRIETAAPVVSADMPETLGLEAPETLPLERLRDAVESLLDSLIEHMPGLMLDVTDGEIRLLLQDEPSVHFKGLDGQARLTGRVLKASLSGSLDPEERFSMDGSINSRDLRLEGRIGLNGFPLRTALQPFQVSLPRDLEDSTLSMSLAFESDELEVFQLTIDEFTLGHGPHEQQAPLLLFRRGRLILERNALIVRALEGSLGKSRFSE